MALTCSVTAAGLLTGRRYEEADEHAAREERGSQAVLPPQVRPAMGPLHSDAAVLPLPFDV